MIREIKFRAWDVERKQWHVDFASYCHLVENEEPYDVLELTSTDNSFVLVQYTGLKDKNGKEIYEGDILADADEPEACIHQVFWDNHSLKFNILTLADDEGNWDTGLYDDLGDGQIDGKTKYFEVIGNIYENSELLDI